MAYALFSWWQLPGSARDKSLAVLLPEIVPLIRGAGGFLEGFWTYEPSNGKSVGFMLLDTAESAYELRNGIERHMEGQEGSAVRLEMIRVQEVVLRV